MSPSFQVSLGDSVSALAEAPFPTAADGKWHRVGLTAHHDEALRLSWDGSDGLSTEVVPSGAGGGDLHSHEHLAFMPNAHIDFGKLNFWQLDRKQLIYEMREIASIFNIITMFICFRPRSARSAVPEKLPRPDVAQQRESGQVKVLGHLQVTHLQLKIMY